MADAHVKRRNAIGGQFAGRLIELLKSPAYRVLSRAAHLVLSRIEIEYAQHGGKHNGELPVTYEHFVEYGVHRHSIGPAIRELEALGFIEVTQRGCAGNADLRRPSLFRLTYRNYDDKRKPLTHEWKKSPPTLEEAQALAEAARKEKRVLSPRKNKIPVPVSATFQ